MNLIQFHNLALKSTDHVVRFGPRGPRIPASWSVDQPESIKSYESYNALSYENMQFFKDNNANGVKGSACTYIYPLGGTVI